MWYLFIVDHRKKAEKRVLNSLLLTNDQTIIEIVHYSPEFRIHCLQRSGSLTGNLYLLLLGSVLTDIPQVKYEHVCVTPDI